MEFVLSTEWLYRHFSVDEREVVCEWVEEHLGLLDGEVGEIAIIGEGMLRVRHLVDTGSSYLLDDHDEFIWTDSIEPCPAAVPYLSRWELRAGR